MKSSKIKHIISISSLTFYLILAGGSTEDTTSSLVKNETPKLMDEDYPLNIKVNEYIEDENKLSIYVITQNTSEEKVEFNLYAIKLTGEDGSEVGPDIMDTRAPSFPVNKSLNKGDKASGWLNFEIPSSSFRPEKLEFQKLMSSDNYGVLDVKGMLAGKDVGDKFEEITISSTQGSVPDYPLNSTIKDLNQNETNFRIYIVTENTSEEKVEFNLYAIKLVGEDGSELGVDLFDNQEPSFPVNKSLNKGDEAAGWLSFEIPSSSFKPKKLEFRKLMSSDKYDVIRMDSDEAVVKKKSIEKKRLEEEAEVIAATVLHAQANYSLDFGGDGTVNMGDVLDMSGDFSISAWVVTDGSYKMIVMKRGQPSNYYGYMLHLENTDKFQFQIQEDHSSDGVIASASVTTGVWVHLVGVFDAGNNLKLYKNGCLASTTNTDISTLTATSADFKLGAWSDEIDEVAIWNTALSADAVAAIYNGGAPIDLSENSGDYTSSSNLQGYWRMNEGTGSTVADDSDNSYTGTISGASWSSTVPDYSLSLDGSDDCVSIADADESDGKKRLEEEAESRNGTYTGRDRSSGSTLELTLTLSGNSWSMKTVPFSVDYGYNTQPTAIYDRGIVKGDDLYDESGSFNLGYISSDGNIKFFKNRITLRKR